MATPSSAIDQMLYSLYNLDFPVLLVDFHIGNFQVMVDSKKSGESPGTNIVFKADLDFLLPMRRRAAIGCDENAW